MNDKTLRQDIIAELDWEPSIDSASIGVAVDQGIVTLTGHVPNYAQKSIAENAVKRLKGVRGIAEELKVATDGNNIYADDDIARRALTVLDLNVLVPTGKIQIKVEKGWLTLSGQVEWEYQRTAALDDLRKLRGVMGISNDVTVTPHVSVADVERRIHDALKRNATIEADRIHVSVQDGKVKLEGRVDTWADRAVLERAAWSAPGVRMVEDHVHVA
ncbi:MAG: BON domain-containing protein [Caulobacteraceae bacterium]